MTTETIPESAEVEQTQAAPTPGETVKLEPDLDFIQEIMAAGGDTLKKCFQCATCSTVCEIAPDNRPFPRKEMIWASWGLKDKLMSDPDVWLCHQCGDCSVNCPRGARPGDTLAAVRNYLFKNLTFPRFIGTWLSDPKYLPVVFGIPIVWILLTLAVAGTLGTIPEGEIEFAKFLPHPHLYSIFITATHLAALALIVGMVRYWKKLGTAEVSHLQSNANGPTQGNIVASVVATVKEILTHSKFNMCAENRARYVGHLAIMYGFLAIAVGTAIAFLMMYGLNAPPPFAQWTPPKILGHLGVLALVVGLVLVIRHRLSVDQTVSKTTYQDWFLLVVLLAVAITGELIELIRFADLAALAYWGYVVHLVFVFALIGYFPYSKFAHIFYRFIAILHSKYTGRDGPVEGSAA